MNNVSSRSFIGGILIVASLSGCVSTSTTDVSKVPQGSPAVAARAISGLPSGLQCFVRDPGSSAYAMPSFGAFAFVRDGRLSASAFARPDLARLVMASNNDLLKKARLIEYVRAVTRSDQEAIALLIRVRDADYRCNEKVLDLRDHPDQRRLRSLPPGTPVNTGSRVATAGQLVSEFERGYNRVRSSRDLSRKLYDNVIQDLRRGRTTESVFLAAVGPAPGGKTSQPSTPAEIQSVSPGPAALPPPPAATQPPRAVTPRPTPPVIPNPGDREFARIMNDLESRGLVGI
jgi:hypothetical protein